MKSQLFRLFSKILLPTIFVISCAHENKETSDMQMADQPIESQQKDVTATPNEPELDPATVAPAKNSIPDSTYFNTNERISDNSAPQSTNTDEAANHENTSTQSMIPEAPAPKIPQTSERIHPNPISNSKELKKTVKFKLPQKSTAKVLLTEENKLVKLVFSASKVKNGRYMIFMEKNCKKGLKSKPIKVAQFEIKKGEKFSGKSQTKVFTLKAGMAKSLKGKALVLYHGPRANTRLACEMVK